MNNSYYANLLLLTVHHQFCVNQQKCLMPIPFPKGKQKTKVESLKVLFEYSKYVDDAINKLLPQEPDIDKTVITKLAIDLIDIYFPTSQLSSKNQDNINYTSRHFVCSRLTSRTCLKGCCSLENFYKNWAVIWDVQNRDYDEKSQLLKGLLCLPCNNQEQGDK